MQDLAMDVLTWDWFYLSGRLQKPVHVLVDNWDIRKVNMVNLKMATSASLLLLPEEFTEYDLYAQICSLSYMGDLRMLFAEDKDKVKKVVEGSFQPFQLMYRPLLQEYISEGILKTSTHGQQKAFKQVMKAGDHEGYMLGGGSVKAGAGSNVGAITLFEYGYPDGMEVVSADQPCLIAFLWGQHGAAIDPGLIHVDPSVDPSQLLLTPALIPLSLLLRLPLDPSVDPSQLLF